MRKKYFVIIGLVLAAAASLIFMKDLRNLVEMISLDLTMETDSRRDMLKVDKVVRALGLRPGRSVADIGAGTGLFTWPMARKVAPSGAVYAVDINPLMLKEIGEKAKARGLANVRTVLARENDPRIPEKVDLIFSCGTVHYIENQTRYFANLHRYLKKGGRIAIIDLKKDHPLVGGRMKYTEAQQEEWMKQAGFALDGKYGFMKHFYFSVYRRADEGK